MNIVKEISGVIPYETYLVKQDGVLSLVSKAKFENENEKLSKF